VIPTAIIARLRLKGRFIMIKIIKITWQFAERNLTNYGIDSGELLMQTADFA
jgi:hypothetical protein